MTEQTMEREEAAANWVKEHAKYDHSNPDSIAIIDSMVSILAAYAHERVLDELREACKVMCKFCERDCALDEAGGHVHLCCAREGLHYIADCTASPIRQRIATLEAEG